jgi:hypothetical protein
MRRDGVQVRLDEPHCDRRGLGGAGAGLYERVGGEPLQFLDPKTFSLLGFGHGASPRKSEFAVDRYSCESPLRVRAAA